MFFCAKKINVSYSLFFTILYILSCLYFTFSLRKLVKSRYILIFMYGLLLFNPISLSGDAFQRLYVNSISLTEIIIFLGAMISIIATKKSSIINYIILGIISSIMLLTRNDNIWIYLILIILVIYKQVINFSWKNLIITLIPFLVIILGFNIVSIVSP